MNRPDNCILVIFGASGDLAKRKLVPALFDLYRRELLPPRFAVLGVGRTKMTDDAFRAHMSSSIQRHSQGNRAEAAPLREFVEHLHYEPADVTDPADCARVKSRLEGLGSEYDAGGNCVFYLATPPSMYEPIAASLSAAGLNREPPPSGWRRIVVEKPFGSDLQSAKALSRSLLEAFEEAQIYRIDHYLGKETVQNLLVFRFANGIFEPLWNRNYVHHVEVTSAESIGVEGRGRYYDGAGALRDMVQNHLLQVVGMVAMEPPSSLEPDAIRNETLKVFQSLRPLSREDCERFVVRGQYAASTIDGKMVPGYRNEDGVAPDSRTETYVALRFFVDNWRWGGVPFYIRTGKRLPTRATEVVVHFKPTPHRLFGSDVEVDHGRNHLVIRIQPDEGILLEFGMKLPGAGFEVKDVAMDFRYADLSDAYVPEPYERLLLDCMLGDQTLFARSDVVEACWEFVTPILNAWKANSQLKPYEYPAGTWGPREADTLLAHQGEAWRNPRSDAPQGGRR